MTNLTADSKKISDSIIVNGQIPDIYLGLGPCRSGTTAFLRVFSQAGIESWYQPLKTILRGEMYNTPYTFTMPDKKSIFVKETIGARTEAECTLDPLEILLLAGVPQEKIHLISIVREPVATLSSWIQYGIKNSPPEVLVNNLISSYSTTFEIVQRAKALGIDATSFVYEMLRDNNPLEVHRIFLESLGIAVTEHMLDTWKGLTPVQESGENIRYLEQDATYNSSVLHEKLEESSGLQYFVRSNDELRLLIEEAAVKALQREGAFTQYHEFSRLGQNGLGLRVLESKYLDIFSELRHDPEILPTYRNSKERR